jgi:hypothetical protein
MAAGKYPAREKQRSKPRARLEADNTFSALSAEYCKKRRRDGGKARAPATAARSEYLLSLLTPALGTMPIAEIEAAHVWGPFAGSKARAIWKERGALCNRPAPSFVMRSRRRGWHPIRPANLRGALVAPTVTHYAAITDPKKVGELLRVIDGYEGQGLTRHALQPAPLVFV